MKMWKTIRTTSVILVTLLGAANTSAGPIYLNSSNISVSVGAGTTSATSNNTFNNGGNVFTIDKVIDAASADATENHNQDTHIWYSGGGDGAGLELLFDFGQQYDLSTLHIWNYFTETYDVDNIDFTFFDGSNTQVGDLTVLPSMGSLGGILAEDIVLAAPLNVRYVTAFLSGTNQQVDFQNIGFTANLSTDRCVANPNDPICSTVPVPEPGALYLLSLSLFGLYFSRRKRLS